MKVQIGVYEAHITVFDLEDLHLSQVIGLLILLSVVLCLLVRPSYLKLVSILHGPLEHLKSHFPLLITDLCIASGLLVYVLSLIIVPALIVEEVQLLQQISGPELAVTSHDLATSNNTSAGLSLSLRKAAAFQDDLLAVALLLIEVGHDRGVLL
jgi:hypothetical protein